MSPYLQNNKSLYMNRNNIKNLEKSKKTFKKTVDMI
jgi:hypothetical protein